MSDPTNTAQRPNMIVGVFSSIAKARSAVQKLESLGYSSEVSVISSNAVIKDEFPEYRPEAEPDDWKGAALLGGSTGAILAGFTSVAALVTGAGIPIVVAGGLASLITGGIVGGLAGVMVERGFETEAADYFELAVADGKTLVAVDLSDREDQQSQRVAVEQVFASAGAEPVKLPKNPDLADK